MLTSSRILRPLLTAALAMLALTLWIGTAAAQQQPVIAFVNLQRVGQETKAAKVAGEKIESYLAQVRQRFRQRQDELREEEQSLNRRRSILAPDAFREEERKFLEKRDLYQREFQQIDRQLQQTAFDAQRVITEHINKVLPEIAAEKGINIIFNQTQVTFFEPRERFDITDVVIERMDKTLPQIPVDLPKE